jgi:hypothetical protein
MRERKIKWKKERGKQKIMEKKYKKEMNHDRMKENKLGTRGELRDEK